MANKTLTVQIHPDLLPSTAVEKLINLLESIGKSDAHISSTHVTRGHDAGEYANIKFTTDNLPGLWKTVKDSIFTKNSAGADVEKAIVVVCSGDSGWKDYLLLHHYDSAQRLDTLPARKRTRRKVKQTRRRKKTSKRKKGRGRNKSG